MYSVYCIDDSSFYNFYQNYYLFCSIQLIKNKVSWIKFGTYKETNYYFYNDIIDLKEFHARLLKVDKKSYKNIDIYYIGYITIKKIDDYESIYSVNPLHLRIFHASGNIEGKMEINI